LKTKTQFVCVALVVSFLAVSEGSAGVSIVGGLTYQKQAGAGETYKGIIFLKNNGTEPQELKLYQTDYQFRFDGSNSYGTPGKLPRSNANWLSFNPHRLVVPAGETASVSYTVKVPNNPNLNGTYWSMIMVEGIPKSSPESTLAEKDKAKIGITQVIRYGVQMVTDITDSGERKIGFLDIKLLKENEKRTLQIDIENTGQRWLRPAVWAEIYNDTGDYIGRFEGGKKRIFPGTSVRYKVDLSEIPSGNYKALLVADCGGDHIFGANYSLKLEK
jgi:hypothetical protein